MIEFSELIERWSNVDRVLETMPEHDRQRHWNMATWGEITDCGTVACAAGHCGLDPWFKDRGFALTFSGARAETPNVSEFFGTQGAQRIFYDSRPRPVETVLAEVREYVAELRQTAALMEERSLPRIGEEWPEQGGIFAGPCLGHDAPNYLLIVGPEYDGRVDWQSANAWAAALSIAGHRDFALFDRTEGLALFDRVRELFQPSWYWSCEQHASGSGNAWMQTFSNGYQDSYSKGSYDRVRAVRRLVIQ